MAWDDANHEKPNPNFNKGGDYTMNCQTCVVAFEARLRGFDVQALPNTRGSKLDELSRHTNLAWVDPNTGRPPDYIVGNKIATAEECKNYLEQTIETGHRYTFEFTWKGRVVRGHIISVDRSEDGLLRLYDPQDGKQHRKSQIDKYLSRLKYSMELHGLEIPLPPKILRIDDKGFDVDTVNKILERASL